MTKSLRVVTHPILQHLLTEARDRVTESSRFRDLMVRMTELLTYEALADLKPEPIDVATPVDWAEGQQIMRPITLVPILRAGLGMLDGALRIVPWARVGHLGVYRDESTFEPVIYYNRLPPDAGDSLVVMLDAMLATGGSCSAAVDVLKQSGVRQVRVVCLIATPVAVERMATDHPEVSIHAAASDPIVGEDGRIQPGLGDVGRRLFGTE